MKRRHPFEGGNQRVWIAEISRHYLDAAWQVGLLRMAGQGANLMSTFDEVLDDVTANISGGSGDENGHSNNGRGALGKVRS
ncbi:hypothetical protein Rhe02_39350 [Rhizocola hellebori]|uniref:Uncharacterized protein n=1 Tax=Rhizocola hellebori TaxID=1392758 RepID=A0A8J3Q825_9ACTN|nr:hypothetical protein Rhe02_39350 [Rhizocola hellebori]